MLASLAAHAIPLAARDLPTTMSGLATGLLSGCINKAISGRGAVGDGLYLDPHPRFVGSKDKKPIPVLVQNRKGGLVLGQITFCK